MKVVDIKSDLRVNLAPGHIKGLHLSNPVIAASGTFGYGMEYAELVDIQSLGAIICKGTTLNARKGNPQPRIVETDCGLLNSVGLENIGVDTVVREKAPVWADWRVPVIVNVSGETIDDYVGVVGKLEGVPGISGIELNISCPNVSRGGIEFGVNPELAAEVTSAARAATGLPLMVKLSPNVSDIGEIAMAVEKAGAHAISLINTVRGISINVTKGRPSLGNVTGGLSGPAIRPIAIYMVYEVARLVHIPVVGCGGVVTASDALEFIMAGATAVQVGTANFTDPCVSLAVLGGMEDFMRKKGIKNITELIGCANQFS
ncbi:MAG: dihydroorotate dehydrogenase [Chloroflexota bacterium]|nr:dihydroorotate dehydrogenase [Chloroflexota bacterium]